MNRIIEALAVLFRFKPVAAWAGGGILLGIACAIHEVGWDLNWELLLFSGLMVVLIQAFLAHGLNDLVDFYVDQIAKIEETGRSKVLISGLLQVSELQTLCVVIGILVLVTSAILYAYLGPLVILFIAVGLYAAIAYNIPPLKLGWRPFAEYTVVVPTLITLVVAVAFVATGKILLIALPAGVIHAFMGMQFFLTSRLMDAGADEKVGKITTFIKYPFVEWVAVSVLFAILIGSVIFTRGFPGLGVILIILAIFEMQYSAKTMGQHFKNPSNLSEQRKSQIYHSIIASILTAGYLIYGN